MTLQLSQTAPKTQGDVRQILFGDEGDATTDAIANIYKPYWHDDEWRFKPNSLSIQISAMLGSLRIIRKF